MIQQTPKKGALSWTTYELERAMQSSALTPFEFDLQKNMIYRSPLCETILGYLPDPLDISLDQAMSEVFPEDRATVSAALAKAIETHSLFEVEWRQMHEGGKTRWVCMRGEPYYTDKNEPDRICATVQDIDARKVAEEQLAKRTQQLDETNRELVSRTEQLALANQKLKTFSAVAAHDLKGPLNSISMAAEILAEDEGSSQYTNLIVNASRPNVKSFILASSRHSTSTSPTRRPATSEPSARTACAIGSSKKSQYGRSSARLASSCTFMI